MIDLVGLYAWTILAGVLAAPALALLGAQLATRDRAMQTLCVGQGAMVGVLCGLGSLQTLNESAMHEIVPFVTAMAFSAVTFLATDMLVSRRTASKNTFFAFIFALLLAAGYLVASLFPALESHMAQIYFGDLATLTVKDSQIAAVASALCLGALTVAYRSISNQSFEFAVFGDLVSEMGRPRSRSLGFKVLTLIMLCLSVQFVGFLFTIAMLFLPTSILSFTSKKGLPFHLALSATLAMVSTIVGFLLSLAFTRLPTVPSIVMVMFILGVVTVGVERALSALRRPKGLPSVALKSTPELGVSK